MAKQDKKSSDSGATKKIYPGAIDVSQDEHDWIKAISNLNGESIKMIFMGALRGHLAKNKRHYLRKISYLARSHDLTFEECFRMLVTGESFGDEVNIAPIDLEEEMSSNTFFPTDRKPTEETKDDAGK